jgi:hypothetical protein
MWGRAVDNFRWLSGSLCRRQRELPQLANIELWVETVRTSRECERAETFRRSDPPIDAKPAHRYARNGNPQHQTLAQPQRQHPTSNILRSSNVNTQRKRLRNQI